MSNNSNNNNNVNMGGSGTHHNENLNHGKGSSMGELMAEDTQQTSSTACINIREAV